MSDDKIIRLAFENPKMPKEINEQRNLACPVCRNKTFMVRFDDSTLFPALVCPICNTEGGRIGWTEEE